MSYKLIISQVIMSKYFVLNTRNSTDHETINVLSTISSQELSECVSHAVAKAVVDLLDDLGYDADQDEVIRELVSVCQPSGEAISVREVDRRMISILIKKKYPYDETFWTSKNITIRVAQSTKGPFRANWFRPVQESMERNNAKMVILQKHENIPHSLYVESFSENEEGWFLKCKNSWDVIDPYPVVKLEEVLEYHLISIAFQ